MPTKCLDTELVNGSMSMTGIEIMLMAAAYLNLCQSVNVLALQKINMDSYSGRKRALKQKPSIFIIFYDLTTLKILMDSVYALFCTRTVRAEPNPIRV